MDVAGVGAHDEYSCAPPERICVYTYHKHLRLSIKIYAYTCIVGAGLFRLRVPRVKSAHLSASLWYTLLFSCGVDFGWPSVVVLALAVVCIRVVVFALFVTFHSL